MIPIRDNIPSRGIPVVTWAIIAVNILVFFSELKQGPRLDAFILRYGLVPAAWTAPEPGLLDKLAPLATSMFLHGGWLHILSNLWSLWIFGDNVEDRLGHVRYLVFYLFCGVAAGATHLISSWGSAVPVVGASGAIAGVMGAYFILFPRARVLTVVPVFIFLHYAEIPAFFYLGFWFFMQVYSGAWAGGAAAGIAWWAHVGGFAAGVYWALRWLPRTRGGK